MKLVIVVLHAAALWLAMAAPAQAGPIFAAIGAVFTAIKGSFVLSALLRVAASVVLSRLAASLAPKPRQPGIKTEGTSSGSQNPASFPLGFYATDGVAVCPPMSHGQVGKTPNAYLTYVIELSDVPRAALSALIINGERCALGGVAHADYGLPVNAGTYSGHAWIKYYDGTQTVADPMLLAKYAAYPQRPWTAAMVGRGTCYAIVTFKYNRKVYTAFPAVRFEMLGIPLYDPRKDTTVGGAGSHRLADTATWETTTNPIVMVYNIHLGITLKPGVIWGGGMTAADLPLASVFAAANACDALVDNGAAGTEPRYRAGYEVFVGDEPASVCEELLLACLGAAADVGGVWRFQAGDPSLPVFFFSDDDILVSQGREKDPFPPPDSTFNAITGSYPDPNVQWEPNDAPAVFNATWEAEDGNRRLAINKDFPAVPFPAQVQRNMRALIKDSRRFLTHGLPLPPEATVLEPLDTADWTSAANSYSGKDFEVAKTTENLRTGVVQITIRERDPADTAVVPGYFVAVAMPSAVPVVPAAQEVASFAATGTTLTDVGAAARRPALLLTWDGTDQDGIRGIEYEVRRTGTVPLVAKGTTTDILSGQMIVSEGILPNTGYEARALLVSDRATNWTAWLAVTSPNVLLTRPDLADGAVSDTLQTIVPGPFAPLSTPTGTVLATLDIGAITPGLGWQRGVQFEARKLVAGNPDGIIQMQSRYRFAGGAFTEWVVDKTFTISDVNFAMYADFGAVLGTYNDYEFRLLVNTRPSSSVTNWLQNIYFTASRVTK